MEKRNEAASERRVCEVCSDGGSETLPTGIGVHGDGAQLDMR